MENAVPTVPESSFGFAVQKRCEARAPDVWLPLLPEDEEDGDTGLQLVRHYEPIDLADNSDYETRYHTGGSWVAGRVVVPLIPGSIAALVNWIQNRDARNQGQWATCVLDRVGHVVKATDVKVARAVIRLERGRAVRVALDLLGRKCEPGRVMSPNMPTAAPYFFREARLEVAHEGGALQSEQNILRARIDIDNAVEDPKGGPDTPACVTRMGQRLRNLSGVRAWGWLERECVDSRLFDDFMAGTETAMAVVLERGASSASVVLPRLLYVGHRVPQPKTRAELLRERVDFRAFGSIDGVTAPVHLA
jgi:hypothetical protein